MKSHDKCKCDKCHITFSRHDIYIRHSKVCKGISSLQCPNCLKAFKSAPGKCKHIKNVNCQQVDVQTLEIERLKKELEIEKSNNSSNNCNNTINNNTTNNTTNNNTTNIIMNNYDNPNTDHITKAVMAQLFRINKTDPNLILNETVRRIYKNKDFPENNSIKLIDRSAYTKVYKGDEEITLPVDEVLQTILTLMSDLCGDRLGDCEEEGYMSGKKVGLVKNIMDTLAMDDREDRDNRLKYIPYVKSALLE